MLSSWRNVFTTGPRYSFDPNGPLYAVEKYSSRDDDSLFSKSLTHNFGEKNSNNFFSFSVPFFKFLSFYIINSIIDNSVVYDECFSSNFANRNIKNTFVHNIINKNRDLLEKDSRVYDFCIVPSKLKQKFFDEEEKNIFCSDDYPVDEILYHESFFLRSIEIVEEILKLRQIIGGICKLKSKSSFQRFVIIDSIIECFFDFFFSIYEKRLSEKNMEKYNDKIVSIYINSDSFNQDVVGSLSKILKYYYKSENFRCYSNLNLFAKDYSVFIATSDMNEYLKVKLQIMAFSSIECYHMPMKDFTKMMKCAFFVRFSQIL